MMQQSDEITGEGKWTPSFDLGEFRKALNNFDDITTLIKGHLYIEHVLIKFIESALPVKGILKVDNLRFPAKVDLAVALNCIPGQLSEVLKHINSIRNSVAHNLNMEISERQKRDIFYKFPVEVQHICLREEGGLTEEVSLSDLKFKRLFEVIVLFLDTKRQGYEDWVKRKSDAERKLADALHKLENLEKRGDT